MKISFALESADITYKQLKYTVKPELTTNSE
jgi:hypothetical protein